MTERNKASAKPKTRKKKEKIFYCTMQISERCDSLSGNHTTEADFYKSYSIFEKNGRQHICKDCIKEFVYDEDGKVDMENFKIILRKLDLPFIKEVFESSVADKNETVGMYFKNIALNYKTYTWDDSDADINEYIDEETHKLTDSELLKKWGKFPLEDLKWLEADYEDWYANHDCSLLSTRKLIKLICLKELEVQRMKEQGIDTDKKEKALLDLLNSGNLTPRTMQLTNQDESQQAFGVWLRDIEKNRPAEYFEDKKLYHDYDGIMDYINRFLFRPMKNLISNSRDFDKEFQPLEFEDQDDYSDFDPDYNGDGE